ncbi:phage tail protein [Pectobacterium versatile]|uniref:phage tail protein n=1 Tax=Pectobacterium versatile TaxID=2488639 RepID=UPI001F3CAF77|nr:phage tail protein [Pectobacterium versatile]
MANLSEQESWIDGIYQLETSDPVVAGPGGISNRQAEQLASRTAYLKKMQETTGENLQKHLAASDPHSQYAPKNSPVLTGTPTAPTTAQTANNTQIATTAFVKSALAALVNGSPAALDTLQELANALGNDPHFSTTVVNAIADVKTDVANKLNAHASILDAHPQYAPKASPAFTGMPTAPTAASSSNDTQLATTAFVKAAVAALVNGSPAALDTLQELANALGNDPNFSTTVLNTLAGKLAKDQNGADIPDKSKFRENVGLVTQSSDTDGTASRVLKFQSTGAGPFGLGSAGVMLENSDIVIQLRSAKSGFYRCPANTIRAPSNVAWNFLVQHWDANTVNVIAFSTTMGAGLQFITIRPDTDSGWYPLWGRNNLPSPMNTDTAQTITGVKTFTQYPRAPGYHIRTNEAEPRDVSYWRGLPADQSKTELFANISSLFLRSPTDAYITVNCGYTGTNWYKSNAANASHILSITSNGITVSSSPAGNPNAVVTTNPILIRNVNAVTDANGYYKTPGSTEITPISANDIAGIPLPFPGAVAPAGWIKCNGQSFDKSRYPILASRYPSGFLPDLRGEFVRGWDDGRGADAGRALMSAQGDAIRNIVGTIGQLNDRVNEQETTGVFDANKYTGSNSGLTGGRGGRIVTFDASKVVPTANENRPRNIAFNYIVRAA